MRKGSIIVVETRGTQVPLFDELRLLCGHVGECYNTARRAICGTIVCKAHEYLHGHCSKATCIAYRPVG